MKLGWGMSGIRRPEPVALVQDVLNDLIEVLSVLSPHLSTHVRNSWVDV